MIGTTAVDPFQWIALGQGSATTDSAGAGFMSVANIVSKNVFQAQAMMMFDKNDTLFPATFSGGTLGYLQNNGTIPYGLSKFSGTFSEQFSISSSAEGGTDTTTYTRTGLNGFAFGIYDGETATPAQPIAGGFEGTDGDTWFPSIDPLTQMWQVGAAASTPYNGAITYDPNGILTLGGMKANGLTRYFNDFDYAISREGTSTAALISGGTVSNAPAPGSNPSLNTIDYFPISTWNSSVTTFGYASGYAVISAARDINGTRGLSIYGWDARDTFWAAAWASQYLGTIERSDQWLPAGTVSLILHITYTGSEAEPSAFTIVSALGTITEFGTDAFANVPYGFDVPTTWHGDLTGLPTLPPASVWWFEKLPTSTTATVQFDG